MLLTNYYNMVALFCFGFRYKPSGLAIKNINGSNNLSNVSLSYAGKTNIGILPMEVVKEQYDPSTGDCSLLFSSDASEVVGNEYSITSIKTISGSLGASTQTYDEVSKTYTITQRYAISNTSSDSVTINSYAFASGLGLSGTSTNFLIFKEKLDEPFVLSGGETVNFDLTAVYNMPINYIPN